MRLATFAWALAICASPLHAEIKVDAVYLRVETEAPPVLSNLNPEPEDIGLAGAELAREDNASTGKFLGQEHLLTLVSVPVGGDVTAAAADALAQTDLLLVDAPADAILAIADLPEAADALIFNTAAEDATLRNEECRPNVLHTGPSMAMR
ncbi:MAG: branched-chain amino acid ABC transporter substrate-binding protein, partial [Pseudomonadota bacterium]